MRLQPMGDAAWRLDLPDAIDRAQALAMLRSLPRVLDAVVTDHHALVRFEPSQPPEDPRPSLERIGPAAGIETPLHVIAVRYDGPDLDDVAALCGLSRDEVIARHAERDYTVELVGFLPGFAYLGPLDEVLAKVPRRPAPRPRVPAMSVAIASGRTAVYPFASPGGWQLLGTAIDFIPFDPSRGATLALGDRVRFQPA